MSKEAHFILKNSFIKKRLNGKIDTSWDWKNTEKQL